MSAHISISNVLNGRIPKTSLQFKQMVDENINLDMEPNKFIQISTYIALQMTQAMKQRDNENQQEYIEKRNKLLQKGKKWDQDSQQALKKIDTKKEKYKELLNQLDSKRDILKCRLQEIHNKHTTFLKMENKKNQVLLQLEQSKKKLEKVLVEKIETDLYTFQNELKKLDEIRQMTEYAKLVKKIKICKLKKEVIHSKIECINKTRELTDLKSLDLNECHCVFCKGYSPAQYHFGIRKDINGSNYRKERLRNEQKIAEDMHLDISDDDGSDSDDDGVIEIQDVNSKHMKNSNQFDRKLSIIEEHSSEEKHDELFNRNKKKESNKIKKQKKSVLSQDKMNKKKSYSETEVVNNLIQKLKKKRQKNEQKQKLQKQENTRDTKGFSEVDIMNKMVSDLNAKRKKALSSVNVDKSRKEQRILRKKQLKKTRRASDMNIGKVKHDKKQLKNVKRKKRGKSLESAALIAGRTRQKKGKSVVDLEAMMRRSRKKEKEKKKTINEQRVRQNKSRSVVDVGDELCFEDRDDEKTIKVSKGSKEIKGKKRVGGSGSRSKKKSGSRSRKKLKNNKSRTPKRITRLSRSSSDVLHLQ